MLIVDQPEVFHRILPGFLPGDLRSAEERGDGHRLPALASGLIRSLFGADQPGYVSPGPPGSGRAAFWSHWFLAVVAPVSQYDLLREAIAENRGLPDHVVCLALSGHGFHGQHGRGWSASKGNLHLSLGLRCDLDAASCGLALTMLPAVAVGDALKELAGPAAGPEGLGIKWVNDILVGGAKIGGVLTSARSQDGRVLGAVLGIGLNLAVAPEVKPTPFTPRVTCLGDHISLPDNYLLAALDAVLAAVAARFEELAARGPGPLLAAYRAYSLVLGREVEIFPDGASSEPSRKGRVLSIGADLSLVLSDGLPPVTTGRLILSPAAD